MWTFFSVSNVHAVFTSPKLIPVPEMIYNHQPTQPPTSRRPRPGSRFDEHPPLTRCHNKSGGIVINTAFITAKAVARSSLLLTLFRALLLAQQIRFGTTRSSSSTRTGSQSTQHPSHHHHIDVRYINNNNNGGSSKRNNNSSNDNNNGRTIWCA